MSSVGAQGNSPAERVARAQVRGLPILGRRAVAFINQNGRFNTGHQGGWPQGTINLAWQGRTRSGWRIYNLDTATGAPDRYVVLLTTGELLVAAVRGGDVHEFNQHVDRLTDFQLAQVWSKIVHLVDNYEFKGMYTEADMNRFAELINRMS